MSETLRGQLEAILFVHADPMPIHELAEALKQEIGLIQAELDQLQASYEARGAGLSLRKVNDTIQLCSNPIYSQTIEAALMPPKMKSLSTAMLEMLAIIAYKQPIVRSEIEEIRGVRCEYLLKQLQEAGLIEEAGHKEVVGKPLLYRTTNEFLHLFGLASLSELPGLEDESIFAV